MAGRDDLTVDDIPKLVGFFRKQFDAGKIDSPNLHERTNYKRLLVRYGNPADKAMRISNREIMEAARSLTKETALEIPADQIRPAFREDFGSAMSGFLLDTEGMSEREKAGVLSKWAKSFKMDRMSRTMFTDEEVELGEAEGFQRWQQTKSLEAMKMRGGPLGKLAGSFGKGLAESADAVTQLLSLKEHPKGLLSSIMSDKPGLEGISIIDAARSATRRAQDEEGIIGLSRIGETAGHLFPVILGAAPLQRGFQALGAGPGLSSMGTGAVVGGLTTHGGAEDRIRASIFSGLSFGAATKLGQAAQPFIARAQMQALGANLDPHFARVAVSRFGGHLAMSQFDVAAFMGMGFLERAHAGLPIEIGQMYVDNLLVVGMARAAHQAHRLPSEFGVRGKGKKGRAEIREAFRSEPGIVGQRRVLPDLLRSGHNHIDVLLAYKASLKGHRLTNEQARILQKNPTAYIEFMADKQLAPLYQDTPANLMKLRGGVRPDVVAGRERSEALNRQAAEAREAEIQSARAKKEPEAQALEARAEEIRTKATEMRDRAGTKAQELAEEAARINRVAVREERVLELQKKEALADKTIEQIRAEGVETVPTPEKQVRMGSQLTEAERAYVEPRVKEAAEQAAIERIGPPEKFQRAPELEADLARSREFLEAPVVNEILAGETPKFSLRSLLEQAAITPGRRETPIKRWTVKEMVQALREDGIAPKFLDTKRPMGSEPGARTLDTLSSEKDPAAVYNWLRELSQPGNKNVGQIKGRIKRIQREIVKDQKEASKEWAETVDRLAAEIRAETMEAARREFADEMRRAEAIETGNDPNLQGGFDPFFYEPTSDAALDLYRAREQVVRKPADPKLAKRIDSRIKVVRQNAKRQAEQLEGRAAMIEANAAKMEANAVRPAIAREKQAGRLRQIVPREITELEKMTDVSVGLAPRTSRAVKIADEGGTAEVSALLNGLKAAAGLPHPAMKLTMADVMTPEGLRTLSRDLGGLPPNNPGVARTRFYANLAEQTLRPRMPMPWDWLRQSAQTNFKMLPDPYARTLQSLMLRAEFRSSRMRELFRKSLVGDSPILHPSRGIYHRWRKWVGSLPPELQDGALARVVNLDKSRETTGTAPVETEFLQTLQTLFGKVERQMIAEGIQPKAGGYFPILRDFIRVQGAPAERALAAELGGGPIGEKRGSTGSRHFKHRVSGEEFLLRDADMVGTILDTYINSTQRALHWRPVREYLDKVLDPFVFGARGIMSRAAIDRAKKQGYMAELKLLHQDSRRMKATRDFLNNLIDDGAGKRSNLLDFVDKEIEIRIDRATAKYPWSKPVLDNQLFRKPLGTVSKGFIAGIYLGGLALNAGSAIKNLTQYWANTLPQVGIKESMKAALWDTWIIEKNYKTGRKRIRLNPMIPASGVLGGRFTENILGMNRMSARTGRALKKLGDMSLFLFQGAEMFNRATTYMAGFNRAKALGQGDSAARQTARLLVSRTQFDYLPGVSGRAFRNPLTHALFQFQRFPMYQMDLMQSVAREALQGRSSLYPQGDPLAPAFRTALSLVTMNAILSSFGLDLTDAFGIAGMPEPLKVMLTGEARRVGEAIAVRQGRPAMEGDIEGTQFMRELGLAPFSSGLLESLPRAAGPSLQMATVVADLFWGTPENQRNAEKEFARTFTIALPGGLAVDRFQRFLQESREGQVLNTRTGEVMFPVDGIDIYSRLIGINTADVGESYERVRDESFRDGVLRAARRALLDDTRLFYDKLLRAGDKEAAGKTAARYLRGIHEITVMTGISSQETPKDTLQTLKNDVFLRVLHGKKSTAVQRLQERNKALRNRPDADPVPVLDAGEGAK